MSEEPRCPFCGMKMELFGHDIDHWSNPPVVVETVIHPGPEDWEKNRLCPLSLLVFPVTKWRVRPIENELRDEIVWLNKRLEAADAVCACIDNLIKRGDGSILFNKKLPELLRFSRELKEVNE